MEITLSDLIQGKKEFIHINTMIPIKSINSISNEVEIVEDVSVVGQVFYNDDSIYLKANLKTKAKCICSRCLQEYITDFDCDIYEKLTLEEAESEEYYFVEKERLNLTVVVNDALVLNMPVKLICNDNCKGLCLACGVNMNTEHCDCDKDQIDPRLAKLKDLLLNN